MRAEPPGACPGVGAVARRARRAGGLARLLAPLLIVPVTAAPATGAPASPPAAAADPSEIEPLLDAIVDALHEGDYALARQRIEQARARGPEDPGALAVEAYAIAWQGAHDIRTLAGDARFMGLLEAVRRQGEERAGGAGAPGRLSYYAGLAYLMRARTQFRGRKTDLFKAAADTRRGVRSLERAIAAGYEVPDASFWIGAYHTMASALPAPLRALKALLGLPGADRDQGFEEMWLAARQGRRFRLEACLFLAGALAEQAEQGYARGVDLLRETLPEIVARGSLLPMFAGELLADWGLTPQALSIGEGVLRRRALNPALYSPAELGRLHYGMARALWQEHRWAEAVPHLETALGLGAAASPAVRERAALLLARCHARLGEREAIAALVGGFGGTERTRRRMAALLEGPLPEPDVQKDLAAALELWREQGAAAALPRLEEFVKRHPRHTTGLLHAGRAAFAVSRLEEAERHFGALLEMEEDGGVPAEALGWAYLYLGWGADLRGRRQEAVVHYRRAERLDDFDARRAGALFAQVPYTLLPSRDPDVWALLRAGERRSGAGIAAEP